MGYCVYYRKEEVMKKFVLMVSLLVLVAQAFAQKTKLSVLVVGNGNAASAAAIQAAVSGVQTTLLLQAGGFAIEPIQAELHSGIQAEFLAKVRLAKAIKDSLVVPSFDRPLANEVLVKWTDSVKNLKVIKNISWAKVSRSGSSWSVKLADGNTLRPSILIIAGDQKLQNTLGIANPTSGLQKLDYGNTIYRTSLASGKLGNGSTANVFSMYNFFIPNQENLILLNQESSMFIGQAAGATAAYAGFFNTKLSEVKLKSTQGELINYKLALMPFADVQLNDPNWKAIQFVGVTGIFPAKVNAQGALFMPEELVSTAAVKQQFKDLFYKAQIWFDDYKEQMITLQAAIDLICYVGRKSPENTAKEVEKKWKATYKFKNEFDLKKQITRREFATLLQDYMPPFDVRVDKEGKIVM